VSRGAVYALQGQGATDITVYTRRLPTDVSEQLPGIIFKQMKNDDFGNLVSVEADGSTHPFSEALSDAEIIVNGILQDTENPLMFVPKENASMLKKGTLIIDISCDEDMGFWCAKPTSFEEPLIDMDGIFYYSVDHSPSYYWNTASWDISEALLPFLITVMKGNMAWGKDKTISKAIEINNGVIQNQKILSFQKREKMFPHKFITSSISFQLEPVVESEIEEIFT
jgi:alanine dehydrogenase